MKKLAAILVVLLFIVSLPVSALAEEGDTLLGSELLYNADFSVQSEYAALPAGWELDAYDASSDAVSAYTGEDEAHGAFVVLENRSANDARVCQNVTVEPDSVYRLTALARVDNVAGERGATLSIDNYSIDGTYCFSPDVAQASEEWKELTLYVRTGREQRTLRVALRLGGYGSTAKGTAMFCQASLVACQPNAYADVVDLPTENGAAGSATGSIDLVRASSGGMLTLILACGLLAGGLYALYYRRRLRYESDWPFSGMAERTSLAVILFSAFVLRLVLSAIFVGHSTDINCFMAWGEAVLNGGMSNFYTSGMFADYPPGYMYVCGFLSWLARLFGMSYGGPGYVFLFKLPATACDLATALLLYKFAQRNKLRPGFSVTLAALFALNPAISFISGAWGQIDSVLTLAIAATFWLFMEDRRVLSGLVYGLAILFKPQALMFGPLLAIMYLLDVFGEHWKKRLVETVLAVLGACAVLLLLSLPFKGTQQGFWLADKYFSTAGSYPYASIEAFNLPALLGGNWAPVTRRVLGLPYKVWGTFFIGCAIVLAGLLYARGRRENRGAGFLAAAFMLAMIFTFGHYMHERYLLPVLLLLLVSYMFYRDRRLLVAFGALTAVTLVNAYAAMYIVDHQDARGALYETVTRLASAAEVLGFGYFAYTAFDLVCKKRSLAPINGPLPAGLGGAPAACSGKSEVRLVSEHEPMRYTKRDYLLLGALTLVYGVLALTNLGTLKAPQTAWQPESAGESVTVRFDGPYQVAEFWVYGNITQNGMLLVSNGGGDDVSYTQTCDDMFRWHEVEAGFTASSVTLMQYSGRLNLNEIAFFDENGALIPAWVVDPVGSQAALLDEQATVPDAPSCFNGMYFDELYHGRTAYEHLHNLAPYENSHPPLGKLFIALGVAVFDMCPFGWRVVGALFGIGMLPIFYAFARRLMKRTDYAFVATALFAFDFMHFTQTRIATIDVYAVFFILLMFYYMLRYVQMNFFVEDFRKTLTPLALSGVFFGLGAACKWISLYAGAGLAVLFFWSLGTRFAEFRRAQKSGTKKEREQTARFGAYATKTLLWCCLFFVAIPFTIYFLSYLPYYIYESGQKTSYGAKDAFSTFWRYQNYMYGYHSTLKETHSYQSAWYQWPFTEKPMWYYFAFVKGKLSTLTASGNPAVWWVGSVGAVSLFGLTLAGRVKKERALMVLLIGVLANYLPWVLVTRCTFIYHFFATVPFILLATVYLLCWWEKKEPAYAFVKWAWLGLALLLFILLYPGLSGLPVDAAWAAFLKKLPGGLLMYGA